MIEDFLRRRHGDRASAPTPLGAGESSSAAAVDRGPLLAYQVHIGLDAQTYNAYTGRWDYLARNAAQTLALIH